jgi:hypothetical protein
MIDKGRATLNGTAGEYHFACPLDQMLFTYKGVHADDVKALLASGASDEQVLTWFNEHGASKTADETKTWSAGVESYNPHGDPEKRDLKKREWFDGECAALGLDPAKSSLFDFLETDDRVSFKK